MNEMRRLVIEQSKLANVGHIGSVLSIADLLYALYFDVINIPSFSDSDRDRFILSKGHAALALYITFYLKGFITKEQLDTYCGDGSCLGIHPEHELEGVDFSTGSLGQGLSMGVGAALAARMKKKDYKTFVLMSDAECNEGSVWEAAMLAGQHKLSNLYVIIDNNRQQALGFTKDVLNLNPMTEKWQSFGWEVENVDGHNRSEITDKLNSFSDDKPHVLIADTIAGKGVSFMEEKIEWHYLPLTDQQYEMAMEELK